METNINKRALIAMSGGVDSSVAALLTKEAGYDCIGATMKLYSNDDINTKETHTCCSLDDVQDARSVANALGMPFYVLNFSERFKDVVMDKFVRCYECGMTPNPCIDCNRHLKFETLYQRARELSCDFIVTGHYAIIEFNEATGRYNLKKSTNLAKDQSYVLYSLTQEQLAHTMFPLGGMDKQEVRELAEENSFINAAKHDSQDICFVPDGHYAEFIEEYTQKTYSEGDFVDTLGNILGTHKGVIRYTIGQRKGLGLSLKEPMYVKALDIENNRVILGRDEDLYSRELTARDINLISIPKIEGSMRVKAKVRYRHKEEWATVTQPDENTLKVVFDEPQRAITKGQALVMYDGDIVIGGGTITEC